MSSKPLPEFLTSPPGVIHLENEWFSRQKAFYYIDYRRKRQQDKNLTVAKKIALTGE